MEKQVSNCDSEWTHESQKGGIHKILMAQHAYEELERNKDYTEWNQG